MSERKPKPVVVTDEEVEAVIQEFAGDAREAVRALLHDIAVLADGADRLVSKAYARGRTPWASVLR